MKLSQERLDVFYIYWETLETAIYLDCVISFCNTEYNFQCIASLHMSNSYHCNTQKFINKIGSNF